MGLRKEYDDDDVHALSEYSYEDEEDTSVLSHKRQVRKLLEEKLERKRLKEELEDELDSEFDWDEFDRDR